VFFGDGLATIADGETHLRNRRLMQPMFNKAHIATRGEAMIAQVRETVAAWPADQPRDVYADMNDITLAAFLVALFGTDLPPRLRTEFTALMPAIMKGTIRQTVLPSWITRWSSTGCAPNSPPSARTGPCATRTWNDSPTRAGCCRRPSASTDPRGW
jgi:pentalenene oxygenase